MDVSGNDVRKGIETKWHEYLSKYGNLFSSDEKDDSVVQPGSHLIKFK